MKAGCLVKDAGRWHITDEGRAAFAKYQDSERFLRTAIAEYRAWRKALLMVAALLRAFMALLGTDDVGIFVNTGGFTRDALDEARSQTTRRVTLVDLDRLVKLWTEHYARLAEVERRRLPLQPVYFLAPEG